MTHAGGGAGLAFHRQRRGGTDVPLAPASISARRPSSYLRIAHPSVCRPLGAGVAFVDAVHPARRRARISRCRWPSATSSARSARWFASSAPYRQPCTVQARAARWWPPRSRASLPARPAASRRRRSCRRLPAARDLEMRAVLNVFQSPPHSTGTPSSAAQALTMSASCRKASQLSRGSRRPQAAPGQRRGRSRPAAPGADCSGSGWRLGDQLALAFGRAQPFHHGEVHGRRGWPARRRRPGADVRPPGAAGCAPTD